MNFGKLSLIIGGKLVKFYPAEKFRGLFRSRLIGKTADSESVNVGSNPASGTKSLVRIEYQQWTILRDKRAATLSS